MSAGEWVGIPGRDRLEHVFIVGVTGSGKTTTMLPGFIQDAQQGRAGVFFDIFGRYSRLLLDYVPRGREVVYLNAADFEYPFAWNELHEDAVYDNGEERYRV
ncbi:MAG: type IV secretion system DNA-binding domain-containing protein [Candidatus Tectomicrobia bacterium]|nr:type IV secretion system DNA-binding domain-containing protein [Candidatus Tectomicrobia bacterium]